MKIKCARCGKITEWENNPYRPFCSKQCKLADLDDWLEERYRIEGDELLPKEQKVDEGKNNH